MATGIIAQIVDEIRESEKRQKQMIEELLEAFYFKKEIFIKDIAINGITEWWYVNKDNILKEVKND